MLVIVATVVELLDDAAFLVVGVDALVAAGRHDGVGAPGQGVRRTWVQAQFTLKFNTDDR